MKKMMLSAKLSLVVLLSLWSTASSLCRRAGGTDCATANGECSFLYDKSDGTLISQLGWPPENNRTCYRTCFENGVCKTHFRHEREIGIVSHDSAQYTFQKIASPRFPISYRTATNCRFNIKCNEGHILIYSASDFQLQDKMNCSGVLQPVCVDWVNHHIGGFAQSHKLCGTGEVGEFHSDGANSMLVEFVTNRNSQLKGFEYFAYCIAPGFDSNAIREGVVSATPAQRRAAGQCTSPDSDRRKRQSYYNPPPTTQLSDTFVILEMSHYLSFTYLTIIVHRGVYGVTSHRAVYLTVVNRYSRTTYPLWRPINEEIKGFGYLWISGRSAYFYQIGAHSVFDPSSEEKVIIHQLETGLSRALRYVEQYDVVDELDILPPRPTSRPGFVGLPGTRPTTPPPPPTLAPKGMRPPATLRPTAPPGLPGTRPPRPLIPSGPQGPPGPPGQRGPRAVTKRQGTRPPDSDLPDGSLTDAQLALRYGNACNGVLRASACAYQHVVLRRNCN